MNLLLLDWWYGARWLGANLTMGALAYGVFKLWRVI